MGTMALVPVSGATHDSTPGELVCGPYRLESVHRGLAGIAMQQAHPKNLHCVALFPDMPALVASDGVRIVAWPIAKVDERDYRNEAPLREFSPENLGRAGVLLPRELCEQLRRIGPNEVIKAAFLRVEKRYGMLNGVVECYPAGERRVYPVPEDPGLYPDVSGFFRGGGQAIAFNPALLEEVARALGRPDAIRMRIRSASEPIQLDAGNAAVAVLAPMGLDSI